MSTSMIVYGDINYGSATNLNTKDFSKSVREAEETMDEILKRQKKSKQVLYLKASDDLGQEVKLVAVPLERHPVFSQGFLKEPTVRNFSDLCFALTIDHGKAILPVDVKVNFIDPAIFNDLTGAQFYICSEYVSPTAFDANKNHTSVIEYSITKNNESIEVIESLHENQTTLPLNKKKNIWFLFKQK